MVETDGLENRYTLKGIGGSNPSPSARHFSVRPRDIGSRTYRRHGLHFWPEGVVERLQGFLLQVYIAEIIIHKADEPDAVIDFFDADGLTGQAGAEIDFLAIKAQAAAVGNNDCFVMKWVVGIGNALIDTR